VIPFNWRCEINRRSLEVDLSLDIRAWVHLPLLLLPIRFNEYGLKLLDLIMDLRVVPLNLLDEVYLDLFFFFVRVSIVSLVVLTSILNLSSVLVDVF
jgi:hypothetical protein